MNPVTSPGNIPVLAATDVTAGYGQRTVLKSFSLTVNRGEWVALLGPNGSGKTTALRVLTGDLKAARGTVTILGRDVASYSPRDIAQRIGVVPAEVTTPFPFTVAAFVALGRHPKRGFFSPWSTQDNAAVTTAIQAAGLKDRDQETIDKLSSGERQRLLLAQALAQEPEILLLDEPTAHLDLAHRHEMLEALARIPTTGTSSADGGTRRTTLIVTHDLELAASVADRICLLQDGHVAAEGTPAQVLTEPLIRQVFGAEVEVGQAPRTGRLWIVAGK